MSAGNSRGFTLLELMLSVAIMSTVAAVALPLTKNALMSYHLQAAQSSLVGAIESTRFAAVMHGYSYNLTFSPSSESYQVAHKVPPAAAFTDAGNSVPWCPSNDVTVSTPTTLEFHANGTVVATTGALSFTISNGAASTVVNVSGAGDVTTGTN